MFYGCGSKPKRVHTTASVPRGVLFDTNGLYETQHKVTFGGKVLHGTSWSDDGRVGESNILQFLSEYKPIPEISLGGNIFGADARGSSQDPRNLGIGLHLRGRIIQTKPFSAFLYLEHLRTGNSKEGKSCTRDINVIDCSNENTFITSSAEIKITEWISSLMIEKHFNHRSSLGIVPTYKYTSIISNNYLYNNPTITEKVHFWTPTYFLYYIYRSKGSESNRTMIQAGLGFSHERNFSYATNEEKIILGDVGIFGGF